MELTTTSVAIPFMNVTDNETEWWMSLFHTALAKNGPMVISKEDVERLGQPGKFQMDVLSEDMVTFRLTDEDDVSVRYEDESEFMSTIERLFYESVRDRWSENVAEDMPEQGVFYSLFWEFIQERLEESKVSEVPKSHRRIRAEKRVVAS